MKNYSARGLVALLIASGFMCSSVSAQELRHPEAVQISDAFKTPVQAKKLNMVTLGANKRSDLDTQFSEWTVKNPEVQVLSIQFFVAVGGLGGTSAGYFANIIFLK